MTRSVIFAGPSIERKRLESLTQAEPGWKEILAKWRVQTFVLQPDSTLTGLLQQMPQAWATVYQDKSGVVIESRNAAH